MNKWMKFQDWKTFRDHISTWLFWWRERKLGEREGPRGRWAVAGGHPAVRRLSQTSGPCYKAKLPSLCSALESRTVFYYSLIYEIFTGLHLCARSIRCSSPHVSQGVTFVELDSLSSMKQKSRTCESWLLCITKHRVKTKKLKESVSSQLYW